jgi:hypothetical protein
MGQPAPAPGNSAGLMVNVYDGTRKPVDPNLDVLVYISDGFHTPFVQQSFKGPNINFEVPVHDFDGGNDYSVVVSANGYYQSGYFPVKVSPTVHQAVSLMLVPKNGNFHFANAKWADVQAKIPVLAGILNNSAQGDASGFYANCYETAGSQPKLACLLNIATAMEQIFLPQKTPLDYLKSIFIDDLRQDRFFALADPALLDQVKIAAQQGQFDQQSEADLGLHSGPPYGAATSSFKQNQFGEANVQLTFHGLQDGLIIVEPDIDYYKSLLAHTIFELIPNGFTGGLTDPREVYVLRWIAGQRAGLPEFDPLYTIE